jgi:hypothetical protein
MILSEIKANVLIIVCVILFTSLTISSATAVYYQLKNETLKSDKKLLEQRIANFETTNKEAIEKAKESSESAAKELAALALSLEREREKAKGAIEVAGKEIGRLEGLAGAPSGDKERLIYIDNMINKSIWF